MFLVLTNFSPSGECHAYLLSACRNPCLGMSVVVMTGGCSWHESGRGGAGMLLHTPQRLGQPLMWFKPPGLIFTFHLVWAGEGICLGTGPVGQGKQSSFQRASAHPTKEELASSCPSHAVFLAFPLCICHQHPGSATLLVRPPGQPLRDNPRGLAWAK